MDFNKNLTFAEKRYIIATQIPRIAITDKPVRGMRVVHQLASVRFWCDFLCVCFSCGKNIKL